MYFMCYCITYGLNVTQKIILHCVQFSQTLFFYQNLLFGLGQMLMLL